jgi:hypothetical protein
LGGLENVDFLQEQGPKVVFKELLQAVVGGAQDQAAILRPGFGVAARKAADLGQFQADGFAEEGRGEGLAAHVGAALRISPPASRWAQPSSDRSMPALSEPASIRGRISARSPASSRGNSTWKLKRRINKSDHADAEGLAQLAHTGGSARSTSRA